MLLPIFMKDDEPKSVKIYDTATSQTEGIGCCCKRLLHGVVVRRDVSLMSVFLTLLLLLIVPPLCRPPLGSMKRLSIVLMVSVFEKWSMPLSLQLFWLPLHGGLANEATAFYKRLASLLAKKWGDDYSVVLGWLRCCLSFSLLRSAIQCIRGARSSIGVYTRTPQSVDLVTVESHLSA